MDFCKTFNVALSTGVASEYVFDAIKFLSFNQIEAIAEQARAKANG